MIKRLLLSFMFFSFILIAGCETGPEETSQVSGIRVNEYSEWVIEFTDGSETVLDTEPDLIEDITITETNIIIHYVGGGTKSLDITVGFHHVNFYVDDALYHFQVVATGENASTPPEPQIEGRVFKGWDDSYTNVTASMELHARFDYITYAVSIRTGTETHGIIDKTVLHGETVDVPDLEKEGMIFGGLYEDMAYETPYDPDKPVERDLTLFVRWIDANAYGPDLFEQVLNLFKTNHYKYIDDETFYEYAVKGLIDALDDPYTNYMTPEEAERWAQSRGESFVGIGVTIENIGGQVVVRKVWSGSPAEAAGLIPGDIITHVDGVDFRNESYIDTVLNLLGDEDTAVEVGVQRTGVSETLFFTMVRTRIDNPSVEYERFEEPEGDIGYIKVNAFGSETATLFKDAVETLENLGIDGLVIDVRNNGGGYLNAVLQMMDVFLTEGDLPMMQVETRNGVFGWDASGDETKPYDIAVLINEYSASASEVFAAALYEKGNYDLIGKPTFGKGTMQTQTTLINDSILNLSIGRWYTPTGVWIHHGEGDQDALYPTVAVDQNRFFFAYRILVDEPMRFDEVSASIANAQLILNAMGYDIRDDGYYDEATEAAVLDFQTVNDLEKTGEIDAVTADQLSNWLLEYTTDKNNDTQLQTAIQHLIDGLGNGNDDE